MTRLFDPKCELTVYSGTDGFEIKDLDMSFDIETFAGTGEKSNPNTAKISIWNMSTESRNLFGGEEYQAIEFRAGHGDDIGLIFSGQITSVQHVKEKTSYRTDIFAGDGIKEFSTQNFGKSYTSGTLISIILSDLISAMGIPSVIDPVVVETIASEVLLQGETYSGLVKDCLNRFANDYELEWSIQYGVIEVVPRDNPFLVDPTGVVISPDTGMVGSPEIIDRTNARKKSGSEEKNVFGVKVNALLTPELKPKRLFQIITYNTLSKLSAALTGDAPNDANGIYVADSVRYVGDNFGGEFYVEVEADKYD